jgi:hypothetical protein
MVFHGAIITRFGQSTPTQLACKLTIGENVRSGKGEKWWPKEGGPDKGHNRDVKLVDKLSFSRVQSVKDLLRVF